MVRGRLHLGKFVLPATALVALAAFFSRATLAQPPAPELPVATRYVLKLQVFPAEEKLEAEARITVKNTTGRIQRDIPFLLYRTLAVSAVSDEKGKALAFQQSVAGFADERNLQVNCVRVSLVSPLEPGASTEISIKYDGPVFGYAEVMGYVHDRVSEEYTLLRPDSIAYPIVAVPSWPSYLASFQPFEFLLDATVPAGYVVAAGGALRERKTSDRVTYVYESEAPVDRMDVAVAKFRVVTSEKDGLSIYVLPEDEVRANALLDEMRRVAAIYGDWFGKKPLRCTVIEIPEGWGSQHGAGYILQTAGAFRDPKRVGEFYHEVAHNWNAKAKPEVQRSRWFDEAFATYFQALAVRHFQGEEAFQREMESDREEFRHSFAEEPRSADTPIAEYGRKELGGNSYSKGPWSLYVLNVLLGDEKFRACVRQFLDEFSAKPADFRDFEAVVERVSGRRLAPYFSEWIHGTESTKLLLDNLSVEQMVQRYR
jgi:hypothetical protein